MGKRHLRNLHVPGLLWHPSIAGGTSDIRKKLRDGHMEAVRAGIMLVGGNQKAREFFKKHKQELDGKIPEKYNSRTASMYRQELLKCVYDDMHKNAKKYSGEVTDARPNSAPPADKKDDEWDWAVDEKKPNRISPEPSYTTPEAKPSPSAAKKPSNAYSSALSNSPAARGGKSKLGGKLSTHSKSMPASMTEWDDNEVVDAEPEPSAKAAPGKGGKNALESWDADNWADDWDGKPSGGKGAGASKGKPAPAPAQDEEWGDDDDWGNSGGGGGGGKSDDWDDWGAGGSKSSKGPGASKGKSGMALGAKKEEAAAPKKSGATVLSGGGPYASSSTASTLSGGGPYAGSGSIDMARFHGEGGYSSSAEMFGNGGTGGAGASGSIFEVDNASDAAAIAAAKAKEAASAAMSKATAAFGLFKNSVSGTSLEGVQTKLGGVLA
eukprot:CAMPEP_0181319444 /NCGR_PEP_ID=MMETSP1101-20121128/17574_1 /TAXON_ID=46948 /ORGANISM="Rhodomonas abbreviata, Strain Caron Lab Isolate" /LENGTH=436 /DNA_ID=CAMNT_0023427043 /DNA_START=211 /DNA_END=1519 /DNA_ORIENTATION=+